MVTRQVILLDMDGVIVNFVQGLIDVHGWRMHHDEYVEWSYHRNLGLSDMEMWAPTENAAFWSRLKPYPWARQLVSELLHRGDIVYCTSPSLFSGCPSAKVEWLRKQKLMGTDRNDYCIAPRKELLAGSGAILIDDSDANVKKFRDAGGRAVLFPQPWNCMAVDVDNCRVQRVVRQLDSLLAGVC